MILHNFHSLGPRNNCPWSHRIWEKIPCAAMCWRNMALRYPARHVIFGKAVLTYCVRIYTYTNIQIYMYIYICICIHVCMYAFTYPYIDIITHTCIYICRYIYIIYIYICLFIYLCEYLSTDLSIYLSIYLSISVCTYVHNFICTIHIDYINDTFKGYISIYTLLS